MPIFCNPSPAYPMLQPRHMDLLKTERLLVSVFIATVGKYITFELPVEIERVYLKHQSHFVSPLSAVFSPKIAITLFSSWLHSS
ncbi:hypothetical protein FKM82_018953 [Ascaphus truei]